MNQRPRKPTLKAVNEDKSPQHETPDEEKIKKLQESLLSSLRPISNLRAKTMKAVFDSYTESGFTEAQAMELLKKVMELEAFNAHRAASTKVGIRRNK